LRISVYEFASRYLLPSLRRMLVESLWSNGYSEKEISMKLGISRSLVSRYLRSERGGILDIDDPFVVSEVRELSMRIIGGELNGETVDEEMHKLIAKLLALKKMCKYHAQLDHGIDILGCKLCSGIFNIS